MRRLGNMEMSSPQTGNGCNYSHTFFVRIMDGEVLFTPYDVLVSRTTIKITKSRQVSNSIG